MERRAAQERPPRPEPTTTTSNVDDGGADGADDDEEEEEATTTDGGGRALHRLVDLAPRGDRCPLHLPPRGTARIVSRPLVSKSRGEEKATRTRVERASEVIDGLIAGASFFVRADEKKLNLDLEPVSWIIPASAQVLPSAWSLLSQERRRFHRSFFFFFIFLKNWWVFYFLFFYLTKMSFFFGNKGKKK